MNDYPRRGFSRSPHRVQHPQNKTYLDTWSIDVQDVPGMKPTTYYALVTLISKSGGSDWEERVCVYDVLPSDSEYLLVARALLDCHGWEIRPRRFIIKRKIEKQIKMLKEKENE